MRPRAQTTKPIDTAKDVLRLMERFDLSPAPNIYEICYRRLTEDRVKFLSTLEDLYKRDGFISDFALECFQAQNLAKVEQTDRVFSVAETLEDEIDEIAGLIELSLIGRAKFCGALTEAESALTVTVDGFELKAIIQSTLKAAAQIKSDDLTFGRVLQNSKYELDRLQEELNHARSESLTNSLTGAANRRHFDHHIESLMRDAAAHNQSFALILADADHFKRLNDEHGHVLGDHVLRLIASEIKQVVKGQDFVARIGGEEFAILLPDTTSDEAIIVANNIRQKLAGRTIIKKSTGERIGHVTMSYGVSAWNVGMSASALIEAADKCLYRAKEEGRDRVVA